MQFLDRNSFDVRAAVYRLTHREKPLVFELFPMVHLAAAEFYESIASRLRSCDAVLFEGVKSTTAHVLTKAYELAGGSSRLGLVTQREALRLTDLAVRLIHADVSARDFEREWQKVPFSHRFLIGTLAPVTGLFLRFAETKSLLAQSLRVDDLSLGDVTVPDQPSAWEAVDQALITSRDRHLVAVLRDFSEQNRSKPVTAGVVFGARHMPAAARALMQDCGYRVDRADWVVVFRLVEDLAV